jgi:hypothetical protein
MQKNPQTDGLNRVESLLKIGRILIFLSLATMLVTTLVAALLVLSSLKSNRSETASIVGCQQLIGDDLNLLTENAQTFNQQLQEIPRGEVAPEALSSLLYGEQPESLEAIFQQITEINRTVAEAPSQLKSQGKLSAFPILVIGFLSTTNLILCSALLVVLRFVSKQISMHRKKEKVGYQAPREEGSSPVSPSEMPGPLTVFVGKDPAENILGAMYQVVYAHENQLADIEAGYIANIAGQFLDRFQNRYDLQPIGQPGQGPLEYDPQRHICWEFARRGDLVWIVQPGWIHRSKIYAKALVSKEKHPIVS